MEEWQTLNPANSKSLVDVHLVSAESKALAEKLAESKQVIITDLYNGLSIESNSFIGQIAFDQFTIRIRPKLSGLPLFQLLAFTYGFTTFDRYDNTYCSIEKSDFIEFLILQYFIECRYIYTKGLHKQYCLKEEQLAQPKGRILFHRLAQEPIMTQYIPCSYHPRIADNALNRVLLSGLAFCTKLTQDAKMSGKLKDLITILGDEIELSNITKQTITSVKAKLNRLTKSYLPALNIIELIINSRGLTLNDTSTNVELNGYLFDMNMFFQNLILMYLRENLKTYRITDQFSLKGIFTYKKNDKKSKRSPNPRPDFVIIDENNTSYVLDAKYRDLWANSLPRDMLYQLAIYALGGPGRGTSVILYPVIGNHAEEEQIYIRDPLLQNDKGRIILRPVNLLRLAELVQCTKNDSKTERFKYAKYIATGK
ncbi:MAG: hypothetical protein GX639_19605 [Fibrobacter sp.]|nr:hypothetical protein [Fibrobacter sp.]